MAQKRMRFGAFIAPHFPSNEHPSLALDHDMDKVVWMEKMGFHEAWMGEHHSSGWEINASPELFAAAVSQRTSTIKLGLGVVSLPYHNPFMVADRVRQLDHITKGRTILGMGPGSLPSDAYMIGVPTSEARDRMEEAIDPIVRLLNGEVVTAKSSWFNLQEASIQLNSYTDEGVEIAVASQVSPTGALAAGKHGLSMLSIGATSSGGYNALSSNWKVAEDSAAEHGNRMNRDSWRLVGPVHIAETRQQARDNVRYGMESWIKYMSTVAALPLAPPAGVDPIDFMIESGFGVIGTPDDFVAQMERLSEQSGGFGTFLNLDNHWADWGDTKRSYELIGRFAIPKINKLNENRVRSEEFLRNNHAKFRGELDAAVKAKLEAYAKEKGSKELSPDIVAHYNAKT
jgi:limonene 1,2-monooxygenase